MPAIDPIIGMNLSGGWVTLAHTPNQVPTKYWYTSAQVLERGPSAAIFFHF
jgi:hypothetical protein